MSSNKNANKKGTLLERSEFLERLNKGEIFKQGTWNIENVRYVGYDITIAEDFLILPKQKSNGKHKYLKSEFHKGKISIAAGETIFVSSNEKVQIPWNLYGNIGTKFYLQANGIILYTGLMIEPGLGLYYDDSAKVWKSEEDERFHFFLFNGGEKDFIITPKKDRIATVQFFNIEEISEIDRKKRSGHGNEFIDDMFNDESSSTNGITFFRSIENQVTNFYSNAENINIKMKNTSINISKLETIVSSLEKGTSQIIMFGVYLVAVTILGISLSSIISSIQKIELVSKNDTINTIISGLLIILFSIVVGFALYFSYKMINYYKKNDEPRN